MAKDERARRVRDAAKLLDLEQLLERKPRNLSGGQRQRVAMGRAIVREPKVFCMDEPLSNLDAQLRVQTRTQIASCSRCVPGTARLLPPRLTQPPARLWFWPTAPPSSPLQLHTSSPLQLPR